MLSLFGNIMILTIAAELAAGNASAPSVGISQELPPEIRKIFEAPAEFKSCGPLALTACADFLGTPVDQEELSEFVQDRGGLTTFKQLGDAAGQLGFSTVAVRWSDRPVLPRGAPAILAVELQEVPHFIAALAERDDRVLVIDFPNAGWITCGRLRDEYHWRGESLHVARSQLSLAAIYAHLYWKALVLAAVSVFIVLFSVKLWRSGRWRAMRSRAHCAGCALICATCLGALTGCDEGGRAGQQGAVRIEPAEVLLKTPEGSSGEQEQETVLRVVNAGQDIVRIRRVVADCGCTLVGPPKENVLNPGETAEIPIRARLPDVGIKKSRVAVDVEAAGAEQTLIATLVLRGQPIQPPAIVQLPQEVLLRYDATGDAAVSVTVGTYERSDSAPWIARVTTDSTVLSLGLSGMEEGDSAEPGVKTRVYSYRLKSERLSDRKSQNGRPIAKIVFQTAASSDTPIATVFVRFESWQPLRVVPQSLFVDPLRGGDSEMSRTLRIVVCDARFHPTRLAARSSDPWIDATVGAFVDRGAEREALVTLRLLPNRMPGDGTVRGKLEIEAFDDQADSAKETVPVIVKAVSSGK